MQMTFLAAATNDTFTSTALVLAIDTVVASSTGSDSAR